FPRELRELTETPVVREVKELTDPPGGGAGGIKDKLVGIAKKMLDIPYRFGGNSLLGIDCSGYVQKVFSLLNIVLPRTAREQFHLGELVGMDNLSIGDLVFFRTYAKFPSHVGIYLGDNRFIHASSRDRKVTIDSLDAPYYLKRFIGAKRLDLKDPAGEI
ncbi:MAG TPA: C40 family peptidase, partial [Candidatus Deferrimicrobiaceae bacterium]|nr:C40 family peptidase [Candidatus Deferrimicrobiaceae bacterium]